jgi:hypothetical protein
VATITWVGDAENIYNDSHSQGLARGNLYGEYHEYGWQAQAPVIENKGSVVGDGTNDT